MSEINAFYPHLKGRISLAYSSCGRYLFTVGENKTVRRFLVGSPENDPDTIKLTFTGRDIATSANHFAVCGDSGTAELFDLHSREKVGGLVRTALPLRSIRFSADGQWVGTVGDDCCRIVNAQDITQTKQVPFENVRHLEFHPVQPSIVALTGMDSVVRIYDLASQATLGELETVVPSIAGFGDNRSTAVAWSPQGESFALPTKTFDIALVSSSDWLVSSRLSNGHSNAITTCVWSPNGRYLASGGRDNKVLVWDVRNRSVICTFDADGVSECRWHPHNNELSYVTGDGQLFTVAGVISENLHPPFGGDSIDPFENGHSKSALNDTFGDPEDEDDLFVSDHEQLDDASIKPHSEDRSRSRDPHIRDPSRSRKKVKLDLGSSLRTQQSSFQTGCTPWLNQKRYLCMSPVGYVWCVRHSSTDPAHHSVTITFFDQSVHREVHFQDHDEFDLAALTSHACVFANSASGKVAVRFHSSMSDNWETQLDLKIDKGIQCVTLSSEVAVVLTKSGFMRTYTLYGTPLSTTSMGFGAGKYGAASVITSSAHENEVVTVHQPSPSTYTYTYEDVARGKTFQQSSSLSVSPGAKLVALFFSEDGEPFIMDSAGILSTLVHGRQLGQAKWVPMLSTATADDELKKRYWPLGVQESKLLCVVMKGQQQYPSLPMPITDEIDLQMPGLQGIESEYLVARAQHEQLQDRIEYFTKQLGAELDESMEDSLADSALTLDKLLLRQFQLACQDQRLNRGLQIVQLIERSESLQAAAKIASAYELTSLAERIQGVIE